MVIFFFFKPSTSSSSYKTPFVAETYRELCAFSKKNDDIVESFGVENGE
jgi:hypothetical protein